jgi:hypothetical protein
MLGLGLSLGLAAIQGVGVLLRDDFERADTSAGDLGTPPIGSAWALKAPYVASYPLPASTHDHSTSNTFGVRATVVNA